MLVHDTGNPLGQKTGAGAPGDEVCAYAPMLWLFPLCRLLPHPVLTWSGPKSGGSEAPVLPETLIRGRILS